MSNAASPIKRRWSIAAVPASRGTVGVVTEQPVKTVTPSQFVDLREPPRNAALDSLAALGRLIVAAHTQEVPPTLH